MKWLVGFLVVLAALAGLAWYAVLDGAAPARAEGEFDLAAYRALVADDAAEALPTAINVEFVGVSDAPAFATEAGAFNGTVRMTYTAFQIAGPGGAVVIDAALDEASLGEMTSGKGSFSADAYRRLLDALAQAAHILITHEHIDHIVALVRHPEPQSIAPRLRLTAEQLRSMHDNETGGLMPAAMQTVRTHDFAAPQRISPGVVAHAAPGHTPGTIVVYARTQAREYLFVGDIAWVMSSIENARGRPRFIGWLIPGVDPDRPAVLRQLRALHDIAAAEPGLVILPAHDEAYLRLRIADGVLIEGFAVN